MFGKFKKNKQLKSGYQKKPKKSKKHPDHYVRSLIVAPTRKVGWAERLVKFLIYIALRIVIKPSKWKDPEKNYEIIDRTYKRIASADMVFIPSSIAFYLIMAFMPVISLIAFMYSFEPIRDIMNGGHHIVGTGINGAFVAADYSKSPLFSVLGKFIPGLTGLLTQLTNITGAHDASTGAIVATILSLVISIWIAASGFSKLVYTQSYIYEHKFTGGYWMNKFKGMAMVIAFTLFLVFSLTFNTIVDFGIKSTTWSIDVQTAVSYIVLIVGLFVGTFCGYILLYKFSPRFKIRVKDVVPGAMVSTIPTAGFLALFGTISSHWSYGSYGSIGVIMYIGMSALIIVYFIYVGIIANAAYYKTFIAKTMRNKFTFSRK